MTAALADEVLEGTVVARDETETADVVVTPYWQPAVASTAAASSQHMIERGTQLIYGLLLASEGRFESPAANGGGASPILTKLHRPRARETQLACPGHQHGRRRGADFRPPLANPPRFTI